MCTLTQKESFDWGIVGVDLDDIELPQDPKASVLLSDNESSGSALGSIDSKESVSIFDRFPGDFFAWLEAQPVVTPSLTRVAADVMGQPRKT